MNNQYFDQIVTFKEQNLIVKKPNLDKFVPKP